MLVVGRHSYLYWFENGVLFPFDSYQRFGVDESLNIWMHLYLSFIVKAAGGKALPCIVDVRDEEQISSAVEKAVEKFGGSAFILR